MGKRKPTRPIVKQNIKKFNKAISQFNKNLKYAREHNKITQNAYNALLIDNNKKGFFKSNIFKESQLKAFINMLNKGTKKSFELSKKPIGINGILVSKYERNLFMQNHKYLQKFDEMYGTNRATHALYIRNNNKGYFLSDLQTARILTSSPSERFKANFIESMEEHFGNVKFTNKNGEKVDYHYLEDLIKKLSNRKLTLLLLKDKNFNIQSTYYFDKKEIQSQMQKIENWLTEAKKEKNVKEQIERIKDYDRRYKEAEKENDAYEGEDLGEWLFRKNL